MIFGTRLGVAFDLAPFGDPSLPAAYARAGATWWLEAIFLSRGSAEQLLGRVSAGPPASS